MEARNVGSFLGEWCERSPEAKEATLRLWDAYLAWCMERSAHVAWPEDFLLQLKEIGIVVKGGYAIGVKLGQLARVLLKKVDAEVDQAILGKRRRHGMSIVATTDRAIREAHRIFQRSRMIIEDLETTIADSAALLEEQVVVLEESLIDRGRQLLAIKARRASETAES